MWTNENRGRYDRSKLRYPSDLTDEEWALIGPLIPPAKKGGNKRTINERDVVDGVMYILSTGCQWAALPKDLPPRSTVNDYLHRWDDDGTLDRIHHALCREMPGTGRARGQPDRRDHRQPERQERGKRGLSIDPCGYDAGKKIKGKKRRVSRTHRLNKEVWCCTRDEGRPLEVGSQVQASNRCKLRSSKAIVVSVAEKPGLDFGRYDPERRAQANRR